MKLSTKNGSASLRGFSETQVLDACCQEQLCDDREVARPSGMADVQFLTVMEVARSLGIGRSSAYELMYKGELRSVKIGGSRRIRYSDLGEYVRYLDDAS